MALEGRVAELAFFGSGWLIVRAVILMPGSVFLTRRIAVLTSATSRHGAAVRTCAAL